MTGIPREIAVAADYERKAQETLPGDVWAWLSGGAGGETALYANREALESYRIYNRILADVSEGHTRTDLLGQTFVHPILLAPIGFQRLAHTDGECAVAQGADAMGACMVASTLSSFTLEDIAVSANSSKWFQLYVQPRRSDTESLIARAEAAGYSALVVTLDTPVQAMVPRAQRLGFSMPEAVVASNLLGFKPSERIALDPADSLIFQGVMHEAPGWSDLDWIVKRTRLPVVVKGVSHPDDAARCLEAGAEGVVVSNHGGRAMDGAPAAIQALGPVRDRLGERATVLFDSGVRSGADIFRALALGANAVLVGRLQTCALAVAGALGVAHMLKLLREELELAMALAGCATLADITPDKLCLTGKDA